MAPPSGHPILVDPAAHETPQSPVRVDSALGPDEDLDREPDGAPHAFVGMTALASALLALLVGVMFVADGIASRIAAIAVALIGIPTMVILLRRSAERARDRVHPSR
jgi:hypothetical protein